MGRTERKGCAHTDKVGVACDNNIVVLTDCYAGVYNAVVHQSSAVLPCNLEAQLLGNRAQRNRHAYINVGRCLAVNLNGVIGFIYSGRTN